VGTAGQTGALAEVVPLVADEAARHCALVAVGISTGVALSVAVIGTVMADAYLFVGVEAVGGGTGDVAAAVAVGDEAGETSLTVEGVAGSAEEAVSDAAVASVVDTLTCQKDVASETGSTVGGPVASPAVIDGLAAEFAQPCAANVVPNRTVHADQTAVAIRHTALAEWDLIGTN